MTSHLNSHGTIDIKLEMLSGVQTGNGTLHDKYSIRGIAHARTKDDIFMQNFILEWGQRTCSLTKHTQRWTYSACCLVCFAAFSFCQPDIFGLNNFDQELCWIKIFLHAKKNFVNLQFCWIKNFIGAKSFLDPKFLWILNIVFELFLFYLKEFWTP